MSTEQPSNRMCAPAAAACALLDQTAHMLEAVTDDSYTHVSPVMMRGTIGKHVRHVLDHFEAALVPTAEADQSIDYDRRERNVPMETDRTEAIRVIGSLRSALADIREETATKPVQVRVMLSGDGAEASLDSTLGRELAFATHHALHHHAMIKVIAEEVGVHLGDGFGKAPSTINHEQTANDSRVTS